MSRRDLGVLILLIIAMGIGVFAVFHLLSIDKHESDLPIFKIGQAVRSFPCSKHRIARSCNTRAHVDKIMECWKRNPGNEKWSVCPKDCTYYTDRPGCGLPGKILAIEHRSCSRDVPNIGPIRIRLPGLPDQVIADTTNLDSCDEYKYLVQFQRIQGPVTVAEYDLTLPSKTWDRRRAR